MLIGSVCLYSKVVKRMEIYISNQPNSGKKMYKDKPGILGIFHMHKNLVKPLWTSILIIEIT